MIFYDDLIWSLGSIYKIPIHSAGSAPDLVMILFRSYLMMIFLKWYVMIILLNLDEPLDKTRFSSPWSLYYVLYYGSDLVMTIVVGKK